jgi:hypothetical protein
MLHLTRLVRSILFLLVLCIIVFSAAAAYAGICTYRYAESATSSAVVPQGIASTTLTIAQPRLEGRTLLTIPEWFIVYSAEEYANVLERARPSTFPYCRSIAQYWTYYRNVYAAAKDYPADPGEDTMLTVIGASISMEYAFKGMYEGTIGRLFELSAGNATTAEEIYAAYVARDYAQFIHTVPWYRYPFKQKFFELNELSLVGPNMSRKIERRAALSLEYGAKALYGAIIKKLTLSNYVPDELTMQAIISSGQGPSLPYSIAEEKGRETLVTADRYEAFTDSVRSLATTTTVFASIAGRSQIAVSVVAPHDSVPGTNVQLVMRQPILTEPGKDRFVLMVPVTGLISFVREVQSKGAVFEHVYDY